MENRKLIIFSSRGGGPYRQHEILAKYLRLKGYKVEHWGGFLKWVKLHFIYDNNTLILTNVPLLLRFIKGNFILNIHGNYRKEKNILKNPLGYLYDLNLRWTEKFIVPNNYLKSILKIENAIVIPNSIEKLRITKEKKKIKKGLVRLICVTHFAFWIKSRGVLKIIESLKYLKISKKIELKIFGKGKFLEEMTKEAKKISIPKNISVDFVGFNKNINQELEKSDIFVYWSEMDIMPTVLIEAMAAGLPVVVNKYGAFKEILGDKNILAENPKEFSKHLEELIDNEQQRVNEGIMNLKLSEKYLIENNIGKWVNTLYGK